MPAFKQIENHFKNEKQCLICKTYIHFQVDESGNQTLNNLHVSFMLNNGREEGLNNLPRNYCMVIPEQNAG
jgi:hypothetical protein